MAISVVLSSVKQLPTAELARWLVLFATGCWLFHPFMTGRQIGTGDALWYANMLADFVTQWRAGVFPVFVGQTEFAFNGAVYPLRVAPLYQHLAGVIDLLTGRQLGFFALQHATVIVCGFAGLASSYLTLTRLAPQQRWAACGLAVLYVSCPGVLGTIYTQDLYMTWMTVPFLPLAVYGLVRPFQRDDTIVQVALAAGLAGLWLGHAPIALWMSLIAGCVQAVRLTALHRNRGAWMRAGAGGALFVMLGLYPFVSVASLSTPGVASVVSAGLAQQERITNVIREVFPTVLLPVSDHARALSDLQLGYGLWLVFLASLYAACRISRWELRLLLTVCLGLLALLLPVPLLNDWLWAHLPEQIKRITFYWPMHRFYLILAALLAAAAQLALAALVVKREDEKAPLIIKPSSPSIIAFTLPLSLACMWSLWESRQFIRAANERTASSERSVQVMLPENRLLMNHAYGLFPALPAYFSNGVMDPRAEVHLLASDTLQPVISPTGHIVPHDEFRGVIDENPGVLRLHPMLVLQPGNRYILEFEFGEHSYVGVLQISGRTFSREYVLPQTGEFRAFGTALSNASTLPLWTTSSDEETLTLRYIPTDGAKPAEFADFARFRLREIDPLAGPVAVTSLLPFRATVRTRNAAWLETPRMFIPGYAATADGRLAEVRRSPQGLVMIPVTPATREVEVRYVGPLILRIAYGFTLAAWIALLVSVLVLASRRLIVLRTRF